MLFLLLRFFFRLRYEMLHNMLAGIALFEYLFMPHKIYRKRGMMKNKQILKF
jgi:hypothetical protein